MAKLRVAGKNMHSVLDLVEGEPTCMVRPKCAKCLLSFVKAW